MSRHLLAYFCSDHSEDEVVALRALVDALNAERWALGPPEFVDEREAGGDLGPGDEPARTIGVVVEVVAPGEPLQTPAEEPRRFVDALARFSKKHGVDFALDYGGELIGTVEGGRVDDAIRSGLLDTW